MICPRADGSTVASFGRRKREAEETRVTVEGEETVVESVNGRLRVFVEGEEGAPRAGEREAVVGEGESCVAESTFVAVTAGLGLAVALLMSSLACILCRRSWVVALQHRILSDNFGRSVISRFASSVSTIRKSIR